MIFIGASNTVKMVEQGDATAIHVLPKWQPAEDIANLLAVRMSDMNIADSDTVVVDLLSNSSFMGSDEDRMPTHAVKSNSTYHFTGNMEGAPPAFKKGHWSGGTDFAGCQPGWQDDFFGAAPMLC